MTTNDGEHLRDLITPEERTRLYALINEHRGIDLTLNGLKEELKFEQEKEKLEAFRENREVSSTPRELELKTEINRTQELWDDKLGVIADLVEDLGLLGVSL